MCLHPSRAKVQADSKTIEIGYWDNPVITTFWTTDLVPCLQISFAVQQQLDHILTCFCPYMQRGLLVLPQSVWISARITEASWRIHRIIVCAFTYQREPHSQLALVLSTAETECSEKTDETQCCGKPGAPDLSSALYGKRTEFAYQKQMNSLLLSSITNVKSLCPLFLQVSPKHRIW